VCHFKTEPIETVAFSFAIGISKTTVLLNAMSVDELKLIIIDYQLRTNDSVIKLAMSKQNLLKQYSRHMRVTIKGKPYYNNHGLILHPRCLYNKVGFQ
jgi:hypothetical protein